MPNDTTAWQLASIVFFGYTMAVALLVPRLRAGARRRALGVSGIGILLVAGSTWLPPRPLLDAWILPPALLLLAYWSSGALFVAPMPRAEALFARLDAALRVRALAARTPRGLAELFELAYVGAYPLIPVSLILYLALTPHPDPDRFWTVILLTDYICFGMLPWIQTRPPRAIEPGEPWRSAVRRLNLRLLGAAGIEANTFPSGHAAEALAAALLVLGAPWPVVGPMFAVAAAISAGAVLGRYHYASDAIVGWVVALAIFGFIG
jgi:membrane-associated phospholipid phosphatase